MSNWSEGVTLLDLVPAQSEFDEETNERAYLNRMTVRSRRGVLCNESGVWNSEFYNAMRESISAKVRLELHSFEYFGEEYAQYGGKLYKVARSEQNPAKGLVYLILSDESTGGMSLDEEI
jgi:hypothetical protein